MTEIHETELPGVGVLQEFDTVGGSRVGVLTTRAGRRESPVVPTGITRFHPGLGR